MRVILNLRIVEQQYGCTHDKSREPSPLLGLVPCTAGARADEHITRRVGRTVVVVHSPLAGPANHAAARMLVEDVLTH